MTPGLGDLLRLARFTVSDPRAGARAVLMMDLPLQARWLVLVFSAVAAALVTSVGLTLLPPEVQALLGDDLPSPLASAVLQVALLVVASGVIHRVGQWRGGKGNFADAMVLVAWLQFILVCVEVLQLVAQLVLPFVADILGVLGIMLFFWLLSHFVAELHGFRSTLAVLGGILVVMFGMAFVLAAILMPVLGA